MSDERLRREEIAAWDTYQQRVEKIFAEIDALPLNARATRNPLFPLVYADGYSRGYAVARATIQDELTRLRENNEKLLATRWISVAAMSDILHGIRDAGESCGGERPSRCQCRDCQIDAALMLLAYAPPASGDVAWQRPASGGKRPVPELDSCLIED